MDNKSKLKRSSNPLKMIIGIIGGIIFVALLSGVLRNEVGKWLDFSREEEQKSQAIKGNDYATGIETRIEANKPTMILFDKEVGSRKINFRDPDGQPNLELIVKYIPSGKSATLKGNASHPGPLSTDKGVEVTSNQDTGLIITLF